MAKVELLRMTPSGDSVSQVKQLTFTFDSPMVPLGKNNTKNLPISIRPKLKCFWRWIDQTTLACELEQGQQLKGATRYQVKVKKSFKSFKGKTLKKNYSFQFSTVRPKVTYLYQQNEREWASPGRPKFTFYTNVNVSEKSLQKKIYAKAKKKYKVKIYIPKKSPEKGKFRRTWYAEVVQDIPRNTDYDIVIEKGILGEEGKLGSEEDYSNDFVSPDHFRLEKVVCYHGNKQSEFLGKELSSKIDTRGDYKCEPHLDKRLLFSNKVIPQKAFQQLSISPNPSGETKVNPFAGNYGYNSTYPSMTLNLPKVLKAQIDYKVDLSKLENIWGEKLKGVKDIEIVFGHRDPSVNSKYNEAVVEFGKNNDIPILVTNHPNITVDYDIWTSKGVEREKDYSIEVASPQDVSFWAPLKMDKMFKGRSGVSMHQLDGENTSYWSSKATIYSPYQVLAKFGHYNSVVWVVDLQTGEAIEGAEVQIVGWGGSPQLSKVFETNDDGVATLPGTSSFDFKINEYLDDTDYRSSKHKFVRILHKDHMSVVPITYSYQVYPDYSSGVYPYSRKKYGHIKVWGTTPQGVYKVGSNIDFKVYIRNDGNKALELPPKLPYSLEVTDPLGSVVYTKENIELNPFGSFHDSFQVEENGAVGTYIARLSIDTGDGDIQKVAFSVLVSDFTPAPFKSLTYLNKNTYRKGDKLEVTSKAELHSGGGHGESEARVTVNMRRKAFVPNNKRFSKLDFYPEGFYSAQRRVHQSAKNLDKMGERKEVVDLSLDFPHAVITVESAIRDDRGKYIASTSTASYFGDDRFLGARVDKWMYRKGDEVEVEFAVLNDKSEPVSGEAVEIQLEYQEVTAAKVKGSGNAYVTKINREWVKSGNCLKKSSEEIESCELELKKAGSYRVSAKIKGKQYGFKRTFYVVGEGRFLWGGDNEHAISLEVEKTDLKVGEELEVLVKNPFPKAQALITIERYGVIDQWIETFEDSAETFTVKVKPEYLPGFYLSVSLFSPRVAEKSGFGELDLGKPSFKLGYRKFIVRDSEREIKLELETDKKSYLPRERVKLNIEAETKGKSLDKVEVAVAILDEAVFDLLKAGESYFDIHKGLVKLDSLDLLTYSLIKKLIGQQKFEAKGANQGGGGSSLGRGLINYLAYWNPSVVLEDGEGEVSFTLPDNLTGWKVLVMAADKEDRLGLGVGKFVTKLPTEIRPALPNILREGDKFKARFSVRNREDFKRTLKTTLAATGRVAKLAEGLEKNGEVTLEAGEQAYIELELEAAALPVTVNEQKEYISFVVKAGDNHHQDTFLKKIEVKKSRPIDIAVQYQTLAQKESAKVDLLFPEKIYADRGGIEIQGSTTLIGYLEEGFRYLRDYAYQCWEQKLSKAVGAAQYLELKKYLKDSLQWTGAKELIEESIKAAKQFQLSSGAMSYYGIYPSPFLSVFTAHGFTWLENYGYGVDIEVKNKLLGYLKGLLSGKSEEFGSYYSKALVASTRAMILLALKQNKALPAGEITRLEASFKDMTLFGKLHFFSAASDLPKKSEKALKNILGSLYTDAGSVRFNETSGERWERIHHSSRRTQCRGLSAMTEFVKKKKHLKLLGDYPVKLARTLTKDMQTKENFWFTTQETLYCLNALVDYSRVYESEDPDLKMTTKLEGKTLGELDLKGYILAPEKIEKPLQKEWAGKPLTLEISKQGKGTLYTKTLMTYSSREPRPKTLKGIEIKKSYQVQRKGKWVTLKKGMKIKRGELIAIDLMIGLPTARHYVIVDDPVPAGLESLNTDLATTSGVDENENKRAQTVVTKVFQSGDFIWFGSGRESFYHKEMRFDRSLYYSTFLPPGNYFLSYKAQAIATGTFKGSDARAFEMYNPEVYGTYPGREWIIEEN